MLNATLSPAQPVTPEATLDSSKFADGESVIRQLRPINRLPQHAIADLAAHAENIKILANTAISDIVRDGTFIHFLVEGTLSYLEATNAKTHLSSTDEEAKTALNRRINGCVEIIAETDCFLARLPWSMLENHLMEYAPGELSSTLEVKDLLSSTCSDWMVRLLQSDLISMLPAANIQEVLAGVELQEIRTGEVVINQGDDPDHFYIIEGGSFSVYRDLKNSGRQIEIAKLKTGDFFGEEALITGNKRGTSVKAISPSKLLKVHGEQFKKSIVEATIERIGAEEAHSILNDGALLVDVRDADNFSAGFIPNSLNLVLQLLRINSNQLKKDQRYIIAADTPNAAAVATFLLRVRGFEASCLEQSIESYAEKFDIKLLSALPANEDAADLASQTQRPRQEKPATLETTPPPQRPKPTLEQITKLAAEHADVDDRPAPVEDYANTVTGVGLADLIEELNDSYEDDSVDFPLAEEPSVSPHLLDLQSQIDDSDDFDITSAGNTLEIADEQSNRDEFQSASAQEIADEVARLVAKEVETIREELTKESEDKIARHKRAALQAIAAHKEKNDLQYKQKQKTPSGEQQEADRFG